MEKHFVQRYQDGEITLDEFQRLNAIQVIESEGHKILSPETIEYLKGLLVAAAPLPLDQKVAEMMMAGIHAQREEITRAFVAKYGCGPEEAEQYEIRDYETGLTTWGIRKIGPNSIRSIPDGNRGKAPRPTIGIDRAGMILDEIRDRIGKINNGEDIGPIGRVHGLITEFYDRWFAFHEETLKAIEDALPDSVEELGGTLPAAVATLAKRMDLAEREANKIQDEMQAKQEEADERWGGYATGASATYGHVGDVSQIISDLDLYQEQLEKLAKEWTGRAHQHLTQELLLYADLLRSACANLEPLRTASADGSSQRGEDTLIGQINQAVRDWHEGGRLWGKCEDVIDRIRFLIQGFGMEIMARASREGKEREESAPKLSAQATGYTEDPHLLVRDILIRIIYSGHPREDKTADGRPDWSAIIARINDFLHPKTGGGISTIDNMRKTLEQVQEQWEPVIHLCHQHREALGGRPGGSIPDLILQIVQDRIKLHQENERVAVPKCETHGVRMIAAGPLGWICPECDQAKVNNAPPPAPFGENRTCLTCGLPEHEHWLTDCPNFQPKAEP